MLDSLFFNTVLTAFWLVVLAAAIVGYRSPSAAGRIGSLVEAIVNRVGNELWIATALLWSGFFLTRLADRGVGPSPRSLLAAGIVVNLGGIVVLGWVGWRWVRDR